VAGQSRSAGFQALNVAAAVFLLAGMWWWERRFVGVLFLYVVLRTAASAVQSLALLSKTAGDFVRQDLLSSTAVSVFLFVAGIVVVRRAILWRSRRLIAGDMARYNQVRGARSHALRRISEEHLRLQSGRRRALSSSGPPFSHTYR
jgi:hypothetical protein